MHGHLEIGVPGLDTGNVATIVICTNNTLGQQKPRRGEFLPLTVDGRYKNPLVVWKVSYTFVTNYGTHRYLLHRLLLVINQFTLFPPSLLAMSNQ